MRIRACVDTASGANVPRRCERRPTSHMCFSSEAGAISASMVKIFTERRYSSTTAALKEIGRDVEEGLRLWFPEISRRTKTTRSP